MSASATSPRIYVASLSDYNNGVLLGAWIDANQSPEDIQAEVSAMLLTSKYPNVTVDCPHCDGSGALQPDEECPECDGSGKVDSAEEWAIHDYEGFEGLKIEEYQSFEDVSSMAQAIEDHGAAFAAWHNNAPDYNTDVDDFQEAYLGEFDSVEDYAAEFFEDCYSNALKAMPDILRGNIDWKGISHDLQCGGDIWTHEQGGSVYVFRNC